MKEFIEKLIGRLEEKFKYNSEQAEIYRDGSDKDAYFREKKDLYMDRANTYGQVMRIINKLAEEYKDDEEQGLLLRLPCKVGDTVYCFGFGGEIIEGVCKAIQIDEKYKMVFIEGKDFCFWKMFEKFGKTVFLTKEEAEQALAEMKGEEYGR